MNLKKIIYVQLCAFMTLTVVKAQQLAFPTAEGFGKYTSGGRGGIVYTVTNLNDSGEGSLRKGIQKKEPRIIVFAVSGTIDLKSSLDINYGDLTIAGQTAPEGGITLKGFPVKIKADNIIIRYLRCRMGDVNKVEDDAIGGRELHNIIIDHCSLSWATDENASFYWNENFTMQWCIISEALNNSVHHKGAHGYGGIWGGTKATFHHNLIACNNSRNPRFSGSSSTPNTENELVDFRNNVIFNWGDNSVYGGEKGSYNMVNNYYKAGPATPHSKTARIVNPSAPYGKFYVDGNFVAGSEQVTKDNWDGGVQCDNPEEAKSTEPFPTDNNVTTHTATAAYNLVLQSVGCSLYRDDVDKRIIEAVRTGKVAVKNGIIDSQEDVGGWPVIKENTGATDSDSDGIPDSWEEQKGLDPKKDDSRLFDLDKSLNNIDVYLNSIASVVTKPYHYTVAQDGTGDFSTITSLINHLPDYRNKETTVYIKNGIYKEKLVLPDSKTYITFIGESPDKTILTYDDYATRLNIFGEELGTTGSSSFFIFGDHFTARNLTFENSAGPVGQAVAVRVDSNHSVFENCRFIGNQDTMYLHAENSYQYYKNCYVEGTVDFIFGSSTAFFEDCELYSKSKGFVTAASTPANATDGFIFLNCRFTGTAPEDSVYLGRPWRNYARTVLINCQLGGHIKKEGWHNWGKNKAERTVFYAEYNSTGAGANGKRVSWAKKLNSKKAAKYLLPEVILKKE